MNGTTTATTNGIDNSIQSFKSDVGFFFLLLFFELRFADLREVTNHYHQIDLQSTTDSTPPKTIPINSLKFAQLQDSKDRLKTLRTIYSYPKRSDIWLEGQIDWINEEGNNRDLHSPSEDECVYLAGNSLGLMPISTAGLITEELKVWGKL